MKKFLLNLVLAFSATAISGEAVAVTVMGARSCGDWLSHKPLGQDKNWSRLVQEAWLVGYLSGMASGTDRDALGGSSGSSLFVWMDNYCQANPLDGIDDGGSRLFFELLRRKGN